MGSAGLLANNELDPNRFWGLSSEWAGSIFLSPTGVQGRFEGEIANLPVFGTIPKQLDGTFYRIMVDPFFPLEEGNPPVEGDGNVCAFRFKDGRVDMKTRYVDTERLSLERQANKRLFGLYRNPFSHHPCVRSAVDSTANTNVLHWAGKLLALKESSQPYAVHPDTLETLGYDPFKCPGKTFSAHPKYDPVDDKLVCYGYEAKGLGTLDVVHWTLDRQGKVEDETWLKQPWAGFIHDCAVTKNFIILVLWPFEADMEGMQAKVPTNHWRYDRKIPATFIVSLRRANYTPPGWKQGETRYYVWDHAVLLHTAGAWEELDEGGKEGNVKLYMESSRVFYNMFTSFDPELAKHPPEREFKADYVRWELDLSQPTASRVAEPAVLLDLPSEMARIDERYMTKPYNHIFTPVVLPRPSPLPPIVPIALNAYVFLHKATGKKDLFDPGPNCTLEEPVFIPRSAEADEGDGWLMGMIQRFDVQRSDLVVLDTKDFANPVAVVQLPFKIKGQVHGNWVDTPPETDKQKGHDGGRHQFVRSYTGIKVSGRGSLEKE